MYFFYGVGCVACAKVEPLIEQLEETYPQLDVHRFEVYGNRSNLLLLNRLFERYRVQQDRRIIPAIFLGDHCLTGDKEVLEELEERVVSLLETGSPCPSPEGRGLTLLSLLVVTGAALVDAVNPCAISVLLVLLGFLSYAFQDRKRLIRSAIAFVTSIYIAYFLFGIGLFSALQVSGLSYWFYRAVGILAILLGLLNLKDFLWYGSLGFVMEVPRSWRPKLDDILTSVMSPSGVFLTGFAVCLFELPCAGGPYLFILGLLAESETQALAIPILLYYNLIFITPLILITTLAYLGFSSLGRMTQWKQKNT